MFDFMLEIYNSIVNIPVIKESLLVIATCRMVFKPVILVLSKIVKTTDTKKDNEFFNKIINTKVYKTIAFLIDLGASIKLPKGKK